jgi:ABC-2 type transport system permease protein
VQQSVPAWLVFAIFFVSIPFSNTFIRERQLGVQRRLATIDVGPVTQFLGKLIPYFLVNQIQVVLMLAAGVFLVPLLGGQALQLNGSPFALVLLSAAVSLAALGLALLIAVTARTSEQATMASGLGAIVLAALGGIMIPKFVMPEGMQAIADLSPMAWGLDGFLGLLLRGGGVADIWAELAKLTGFGLVTLGAAWLVHRYQK